MATDKFNFPQMFFLSETTHRHDAWQPRADVYRTHDGWLVKFELAGVRLDEIRLATEASMLIVHGTRRDEHCHSGMGCHCLEIAYSSFQRAVELPGLSEAAEIVTSVCGRHAAGADQDGEQIVTSENQLVVEAKPDALGSLPVLPLKNSVLFPHLFMPLSVGRPASVAAVEAILATEEKAFLAVALKNLEAEPPTAGDFYTVGTRAVVKKMARSGAGIELLVQGVERVAVVGLEQTEPYLRARVRPLPLPDDTGAEVEALRRAVLELTARALELAHPEAGFNIDQLAAQAPDPLILAFLVGSMMSLDVAKEQALLEAPSRAEGLRLIHGYLTQELQVLELRQKITSQAQNEMGKEQREYLLRQQLRAIQGELGETSPERAEVQELRDRLIAADLPEEVHKEFERELSRMERLPSAAPDYQITRTYLEPGPRASLAEVDGRRSGLPLTRPSGCSTKITSISRRSRSGSSSIWRC